MPALRWFGRSWRTGSDDFTFSGCIYFGLLLVSSILVFSEVRVESGAITLVHCSGENVNWKGSYFSLGCVNVIGALCFIATAVISARGSLFELSKRAWVPTLLYADLLLVVLQLALAGYSVRHAVFANEMVSCARGAAKGLIYTVFSINFGVVGSFTLMFAVSYTVSGSVAYESTDAYAQTWGKRCRLLCCRCDTEKHDEAFRDVARVLAETFRGYDMVPSDLAAGFLLLHGYQSRSRRIIADTVHYAPAPSGVRERKSTQACPCAPLTDAQVAVVEELQLYSPFYLAVYGWLLHEYRHCCSGLARLCCRDPFMCCRYHSGRHYGTRYYCDVTTLVKETQIPEEDIILTSWRNSVFKPVHYVAYNRRTDAIVVAIRGTMSFIDCVTDLAATPTVIPLNDTPCGTQPADYFVHGGMYKSALYVRECLEYNGVLDMMRTGKYKSKKVVILGHSLGAGVALILSTLLWSEAPEVRTRLRCLAYAPPGGTLSKAVTEYARDFSVGAFMGYDMIPRVAQHTFDSFREALFDVMAASSVPKSLLFLNFFRSREVASAIHPSSPTSRAGPSESQAFRESLRQTPIGPAQEPAKLYPCATLVHLRKAVEVDTGCLGKAECIYVPRFVGPEEVQMILSAPTMFTDHFPDRLYDVLEATWHRLESGDLDRFFVQADQGNDETSTPVSIYDLAPMHYVAPRSSEASTTSYTAAISNK